MEVFRHGRPRVDGRFDVRQQTVLGVRIQHLEHSLLTSALFSFGYDTGQISGFVSLFPFFTDETMLLTVCAA